MLAAFLGGGFGLGEFFGKTAAIALSLDRGYWGDLMGVLGGWLGSVLWLFIVIGTLTS